MFMASNVGINDNNDVPERIEVEENDSKTRSKLKEIFNEGDDAANVEKVASKVSNPRVPFVDSDDSLSSDTNNDDSDDMDYEMEQFYSSNSKDSSSSEGDNLGLIYCTYLLAIGS